MITGIGDMENRAHRLPNLEAVRNRNGSGVETPRALRFGVFELDLHAGELRRNGMRVRLQEQPFQVLTQLLESPGHVVTREELRGRLWPADTFVDFDHSLNAAIRRLRDALGDSAENPTFVETVARRGYRFLAPVSLAPTNGNGGIAFPLASADSPPLPVSRFHALWIVASAAAVALVLIGLKLGLLLGQHHSASSSSAAPVRISRLTANPADDPVRTAAVSRDGRYLAFSDETGFYLRQIETGETHAIRLPPGLMAGKASWFPDSAHLVLALTRRGQTPSLWEVPALGGEARKLSDDGNSPAVSPDGKQIAFITGNRMRNQVWLMAANAEQPRKLVGEDGDVFGALAWSADGARIAYTRGRVSYSFGVKGAIEFVDTRNLQVSPLLDVNRMGWFRSLDGPLTWSSDGRLIYSLVEAPPRQLDSNLWSLALDPGGHPTGDPVRLTSDPGAVQDISTSGDGKRIAYLKGVPQPDVYVARLEGQNISEPVRITLDDRQDLPYDWTPDGKAVLFISDRTGMFNVYRQAVDQAVPDLVAGGSHPYLAPRLSPDGTQLLYLVYPNWTDSISSISLMRMPLAGGAPQEVLEGKWISNQQCARAPATLCLYSIETEGKLTLLSFDPMKGTGAQVYQVQDTLPQLYNWSLSPDGTTLAIAKGKDGGEEPRIHLVSLNSAREKWLSIRGWTGVGSLDWAADSKSLWASSVGDEGNALLNIDLRGNARVVWRPRTRSVYWAIPSRDGRRLALHVGSTSANAWMLERP